MWGHGMTRFSRKAQILIQLILQVPRLVNFTLTSNQNVQLIFPPRVELDGCPGEPSPTRFLYFALLRLEMTDLLLNDPILQKQVPVEESPQYGFFKELDNGKKWENTNYADKHLSAFPKLYGENKVKIYKLAGNDQKFSPLVLLSKRGRAVVIDGTHRAAAMARFGQQTVVCKVVLWLW